MTGGTLIISRAEKLHSFYKNYAMQAGFRNVTITKEEKDSLNFVIRDCRPDIVLIGSGFYKASTPYMMMKLLEDFPSLNINMVNIHEYPDDLAMYFIINGVNSYVNVLDGIEEFKRGLAMVRDGEKYISPLILERINQRHIYPKSAILITGRQLEVLKLICCGFKEHEIADTLHISRSTVDVHKQAIFRTLNVRNSVELIKAALKLELIMLDDIYFYPENFTVKPHPNVKHTDKKELE